MSLRSSRKNAIAPAEQVPSSQTNYHLSRSMRAIHLPTRGLRASGHPSQMPQPPRPAQNLKRHPKTTPTKLHLSMVPRLIPTLHNHRNPDFLGRGSPRSQGIYRMKTLPKWCAISCSSMSYFGTMPAPARQVRALPDREPSSKWRPNWDSTWTWIEETDYTYRL